MKKDYLEEGAMADTADLVVLGAYYGTGNKGNMTSEQFSELTCMCPNVLCARVAYLCFNSL